MVIGGGGEGQRRVDYLFLLRELMHLECICTQITYMAILPFTYDSKKYKFLEDEI